MPKARLISFVFLCLLCVYAVHACSKAPSPEGAIKEALSNAAAAAGEKDVKGVMRHVSNAFKNDEGLDYNAVKAVLLSELFRGEKTRVFIVSMNVEVKGETAVAEVKAVIVRGKKDVSELKDVLPADASAKRFSIVFKKEEDGWKVVSAVWEGIGLAGLV